jgi:biotin operon repressor
MTTIAIRPRSRGMPWTAEEDAALRAVYGQALALDIGRRLGRTAEAVRQRAMALGLSTPVAARIRWTEEANALMRERYARGSSVELARALGTTAGAVTKQAQALGLARPTPHRPWTPERDRLLREMYGLVETEELADRLGVSRTAVYNRLKQLGINRNLAQATRYARDQDELHRLRALVGADALDAEPTIRRLRILLAYRMGVLTEAEAAVAAGIAPGRLIVECGKEARRGLEAAEEKCDQ